MTTALTANCSFNVKALYGMTWNTIAQYQLSSLGAGCDFNMANFTLGVALPNQNIKITFINNMLSAVSLNTAATLSFSNITRIA